MFCNTLLKKTHICFVALNRLASEIFLSSLQTEFFSTL